VRRGHSEAGGAETYLKRLAEGLSRAGHEMRLFTDASWPTNEWRWGAITRLRGETPRRFADELEMARPEEHCDLLLSLERVWRCDVYRAGDGIHQAWLQRRDAASSPARKLLRTFGRSHRDTLDLEKSLFTGGARRVIVPVCQWYIWRPVFIRNGNSASGSSAGGRNSTPTSVALPSAVGK